MKDYIKLIRVKHWLKNGLVFLPLFFSLNLFTLNMVLKQQLKTVKKLARLALKQIKMVAIMD